MVGVANPKDFRSPFDPIRRGEGDDDDTARIRRRTAQLNRVIAWCWVAAFVAVAIGILVGRY